MSQTQDIPTSVRFESGQVYDAVRNEQIDLSSSHGKQIQQAAEQYGKNNNMQWTDLSGQFRYDTERNTLVQDNSGTSSS